MEEEDYIQLHNTPEILIHLRDIILSATFDFEIFYGILKITIYNRYNINHMFHDKNDLSLGKTLLTISVIRKMYKVVELLLDHGADVSDNNGCEELHQEYIEYISACYRKYNINKWILY